MQRAACNVVVGLCCRFCCISCATVSAEVSASETQLPQTNYNDQTTIMDARVRVLSWSLARNRGSVCRGWVGWLPPASSSSYGMVKHFKHGLLAALCKYLRGYCSIQWNKRGRYTERNKNRLSSEGRVNYIEVDEENSISYLSNNFYLFIIYCYIKFIFYIYVSLSAMTSPISPDLKLAPKTARRSENGASLRIASNFTLYARRLHFGLQKSTTSLVPLGIPSSSFQYPELILQRNPKKNQVGCQGGACGRSGCLNGLEYSESESEYWSFAANVHVPWRRRPRPRPLLMGKLWNSLFVFD